MVAVGTALAIGQRRLGVHGTCGLNNPCHRACGRCQADLEIPDIPPYVTPRGSAAEGDKKNEET